jgi:PPOX class probable F420-dependent enzyme
VTSPPAERPGLAPTYGISRDPEGLLSWDYVAGEAERSRNYWVVTVRPDGRPHTTPVWGVWVDDAIFFGTSDASVKGRNLARDPRLVVHLESGDDVVIFEGTAKRERLEPELHRRIVTAYAAKYDMVAKDLQGPEGWFRLRATTVLAWHESDFVRTATRWRPT